MTRHLTLVREDSPITGESVAQPSATLEDRWQRITVEAHGEVPKVVGTDVRVPSLGAHLRAAWEIQSEDHSFALLEIGGLGGFRFDQSSEGQWPGAIFEVSGADARVLRCLARLFDDLATRVEAVTASAHRCVRGDRLRDT